MIPRDVFADVRAADGEFLGLDAYQAEFEEVYRDATEVVWKLERAQHFHEPAVPSWQAADAGDWALAVALIEEMRAPLTAMYRERAPFRRLRVVELPVTPYLQWEAQIFTVRVAAGEEIRVIDASAVAPLETRAPLPELVIFGPNLLYEVRYDEIGAAVGARRITDPGVVSPCLSALISLYAEGEELLPFFEREVAPLPPPAGLSERPAGIGP
ncbi:hypothetical protein GCM10010116_53120 [Microbispora rosea subsp. aerata]|nr:DUF6879 family protein [Microbispora rosea]GGO26459.1 hypothetical protein GCM10010116_53120 [Microbispora rosea subsp. aerata]GIH54229.1 hypothetical protein Mro02_11430 [Microbispora rosea subsp. aerata]GLJ83580.1 hypothetical protein GCM10017588_23080 [Microbispora rosea subsp. aerata]